MRPQLHFLHDNSWLYLMTLCGRLIEILFFDCNFTCRILLSSQTIAMLYKILVNINTFKVQLHFLAKIILIKSESLQNILTYTKSKHFFIWNVTDTCPVIQMQDSINTFLYKMFYLIKYFIHTHIHTHSLTIITYAISPGMLSKCMQKVVRQGVGIHCLWVCKHCWRSSHCAVCLWVRLAHPRCYSLWNLETQK